MSFGVHSLLCFTHSHLRKSNEATTFTCHGRALWHTWGVFLLFLTREEWPWGWLCLLFILLSHTCVQLANSIEYTRICPVPLLTLRPKNKIQGTIPRCVGLIVVCMHVHKIYMVCAQHIHGTYALPGRTATEGIRWGSCIMEGLSVHKVHTRIVSSGLSVEKVHTQIVSWGLSVELNSSSIM